MTEDELDRLTAAVLATPDGKLLLAAWADRFPYFHAEQCQRIRRMRRLWSTGAHHKDMPMPISPAERLREAMGASDRQRAHDIWDEQCRALGHPPLDDEGQPIPDPLDQ